MLFLFLISKRAYFVFTLLELEAHIRRILSMLIKSTLLTHYSNILWYVLVWGFQL